MSSSSPFAARHIAEASEADSHGYYGHAHLRFDADAGRAGLRRDVNTMLRRSGLAFEMTEAGRVHRLAPPVTRDHLASGLPPTGRHSLDRRLSRAVEKYGSPDPVERAEALEKLWDAWEELKTIRAPKPQGVTALVEEVAVAPEYRGVVDADARALTAIGNDFQIRHTETGKVALQDSRQVDYFFGRLFNLICGNDGLIWPRRDAQVAPPPTGLLMA